MIPRIKLYGNNSSAGKYLLSRPIPCTESDRFFLWAEGLLPFPLTKTQHSFGVES